MKKIRYILSSCLALLLLLGCNNENDNFDYLDNVTAPANVSALFQITQNNTGLVTITPNAEGAVSYNIKFGDGTTDEATVKQGGNTTRTYAEGTYSVIIEAIGITGLITEVTKDIVVSFKAPVIIGVPEITNDAAISKRVNVLVNADFGMFYEVYFGEPGNDVPVLANVGEIASYTYQTEGTYPIRIVVKGGAIETTEYTQDFLVTAILQPLASAQKPPFRQASDVISIFSGEYTNITGTDFFPDWDQTTTYTAFNLNGDAMIQYTNLNYQGIDIGEPVEASTMQTLHIDIWVSESFSIDIFPLPEGIAPADEKFVTKQLIANQWNRFDILLTDFSSQGLALNDIRQFKFVGSPVGKTLFIDNLYFWKEPSNYTPLLFDNFDGNSNITTWAQDATVMTLNTANIYNKGINTSLKVLKYEDTGGQFANIRLDASGNFDLTTASTFTLKLYVPSSGLTGSQPNIIQLKLQNGNAAEPWAAQSAIQKTVVLDQWQEITFDFATDAILGSANPLARTDFNRVVLQLNGENNFDHVIGYFDDFTFGSTPPADTPPFATDDFEGNGTITTWAQDAAIMTTNFAIGALQTGMNYSNTVLKYDDNGSGQYANIRFEVAPNFNLNQKSKFTMKLYVPSSGITGTQTDKIQLKLQNGTAAEPWASQSVIEKIIVLNQWQEITFDFATDVILGSANPLTRTDFNRVVIQLNGENNNDQVIGYIDDFKYHK